MYRSHTAFLIVTAALLASCGASDVAGPIEITTDEPATTPVAPTQGGDIEQRPALSLSADVVHDGLDLVIDEPLPRCVVDGPTCYPIFLAHGFMANPDMFQFYRVAEHLRAQGFYVVEGAVPAFDSVEVRGTALAAQLEGVLEDFQVDKVNIIAHSMGGLDARYAISTLSMGDRVASLTTISTPHRGSAAADLFLAEQALDEDSPIVGAVLTALGTQYSDGLADDPKLRAGLFSLSEEAAPAFNANNPDDPRVDYQSWAGISGLFGIRNPRGDDACDNVYWQDNGEVDTLETLFIATAPLVAHGASNTPNDGMVTVDSARWGSFRGCLHADHADEVGQLNDDGPDPKTGWDHLEFFSFLAQDLVDRGY